jgi:hypothetical protein
MAVALGSNDNSAASPTIRDVDGSANEFIYTCTPLLFSGSYSTGGDTLDLTPLVQAATPLAGIGNLLNVVVESNGPSGSQGFGGGYYFFSKGTTLANGKLLIFASGGSQLGAGAYPSAVTTDVVSLVCTWRKFQ